MTVFHIAHASEWDAALALGEYRTSTRGLSIDDVGFIHASTAAQVGGVAESFYRDDPEPLVVLEIDEVGLDVRWEDGGEGELFPHVYQALPLAAVTTVIPARIGPDGLEWRTRGE